MEDLFSTDIKTVVAVLNFNKITKTSITASNRIALFIARKTGGFLIDDKMKAMIHKNDSFEVLYVVNGMFGFCDFRDECVSICEKAKKIVWVTNDYDIKIPSQLNFFKNGCIRMAEFPNHDNHINHFQISWNKLTYEPCEHVEHFKYPGLFYYGAFRKNRQEYFVKYMNTDKYNINISTSEGNYDKFKEVLPSAYLKLTPASTGIYAQLSNYQFTVYMTDNMKHPVSFANRFYECLGGGLFMLFDRYALSMMNFEGDGIDKDKLEWFAVDSQDDVMDKLKHRGTLLQQQQYSFHDRDFKKELEDRFDEIVKIIS